MKKARVRKLCFRIFRLVLWLFVSYIVTIAISIVIALQPIIKLQQDLRVLFILDD